jgi:hypothetical protein
LSSMLARYMTRHSWSRLRAASAALTDLELEYFGERKIRFEINGIDADERMAYVEERLREADIRPKYVPPANELAELVADDFDATIQLRVASVIDSLVDKEAIVTVTR